MIKTGNITMITEIETAITQNPLNSLAKNFQKNIDANTSSPYSDWSYNEYNVVSGQLLFLTMPTEMSASAGNPDLNDRLATFSARFAGPAIDIGFIKVMTSDPFGIEIVTSRRSAQLHGALQNFTDRTVKFSIVLVSQCPDFTIRHDAGQAQSLITINIANTGHDGLIQQGSFHRSVFSA